MARRVSLDDMLVFAAVVEARGFSAAARRLGLPKATVSRRIAELEAALGARLLQRTTRVVTPTAIGAAYHLSCARIAAEAESAEALVAAVGDRPRGVVRFSCPFVAAMLLAPALRSFVQEHPEVELDVEVTDRLVDLVTERIDLALRVQVVPKESSLIVKTIAAPGMRLFASPAYLARGTPARPEDLDVHEWIRLGSVGSWTLEKGAERRTVKVQGRVRVSSIALAAELAIGGSGVVLVPPVLVTRHVAAGRLLPVLPEWSMPTRIFAAYPAKKHLTPGVRALLDAVTRGMATLSDEGPF